MQINVCPDYQTLSSEAAIPLCFQVCSTASQAKVKPIPEELLQSKLKRKQHGRIAFQFGHALI